MKIKNKFLGIFLFLVFFISCGLRGMYLKQFDGYRLANGQGVGIFWLPGAIFEVKEGDILINHHQVLENIIINQKKNSVYVFETSEKKIKDIDVGATFITLLKSKNLIDILGSGIKFADEGTQKYKYEFLELTFLNFRRIEEAICFLRYKSGCNSIAKEFDFGWLLDCKKRWKNEVSKRNFCTKKSYLKDIDKSLKGFDNREASGVGTCKLQLKKDLEENRFLLKRLGLKDRDRIIKPLLDDDFKKNSTKFKNVSEFYKDSLLLSAKTRALWVVIRMLKINKTIPNTYFFCFGVPGFPFTEFLRELLKEQLGLEPFASEKFTSSDSINFVGFKELFSSEKTVKCYGCQKIGLSEEMKQCSRCKAVFYCGRACQVKDWTEHKKVCKA